MSVPEIVSSLVGAAGGSAIVVTGLAAWLGRVWENRIAREHQFLLDRIAQVRKLMDDIDVDLRNRRIEVYRELWTSTSVLPKWPKAKDVTYEHLLQFSKEVATWYFTKGGMYLSRSTHDQAYGPLQDKLAEVIRASRPGPVSEEHYEDVRRACSTLRSALARDIESRREGL